MGEKIKTWQTIIKHFSLGYHGAIHAENTSASKAKSKQQCVSSGKYFRNRNITQTQSRRVATLNNQRLFVSQWLPAARPVSLTACALSLSLAKCGANSRRWSNTGTGACITHISCAHTLMAHFFCVHIRFLREGVDVVHALTSLAHILMQNLLDGPWLARIDHSSSVNYKFRTDAMSLAVTYIQQNAMVTTCTWLMAWWWWKTDGVIDL